MVVEKPVTSNPPKEVWWVLSTNRHHHGDNHAQPPIIGRAPCGSGAEADECGGVVRNVVVILTIVGDWGNQWAPGETSVPF